MRAHTYTVLPNMCRTRCRRKGGEPVWLCHTLEANTPYPQGDSSPFCALFYFFSRQMSVFVAVVMLLGPRFPLRTRRLGSGESHGRVRCCAVGDNVCPNYFLEASPKVFICQAAGCWIDVLLCTLCFPSLQLFSGKGCAGARLVTVPDKPGYCFL